MATDPRNGSTVLPEPGKRNVLVTSALPYVNNIPHLGNIIGGRGINTLYVGGTDEYGTTTETRALAEGCTPKELCDKYRVIHADVYKWFNISFDIFRRTTIELQTETTQDIFLSLNRNGLLKERQTTQLYCEAHQSFLADRFVEGECPACVYPDAHGDQCDDLCGRLLDTLQLKNPRCKVDGSVPITRETNHVFIEPDKLQPGVEALFRESSAVGEWSNNGKAITSAWLKEGLEPRSITRDMESGTNPPLLGYEGKGTGFLQSNKLDGNLCNNEPSKCAAVIGIAVKLVHLIASLLAPYMPDTANSINKQLRADPLPIPDCWSTDSILPGHKIGKAEHLFRPIKPEKAQEWRKAFGADKAKKAKEEDAALKVKKKAALRAAKAAKADST
ncbi:hypothetical protein EKO27_g10494 [Xylaria grammica]|uniref:methionine--tRNA ligase n=1 Tax=Xylaria grammica TaxID=363999 RepID=A0A439CR14_9PEZI|nr:hypothetical protein EKO27_g10494 [Xylaria grammica]